jgi:hypothetical protein
MVDPTGPTPEQVKEATRILSKAPRAWHSAKTGALVGLIAAGLALGYKENTINAFLSSKTAQQEIARVLVQERDTRTMADKLFRRGVKPAEIPVGNQFRTMRDANGRIVSIGKDRILANVPKYMSPKMNVPLTKDAIPYGAVGAGLGAGAGVLLGLRKRKKLEKLASNVLAGNVPISQRGRAMQRAQNMKTGALRFGGKVKTNAVAFGKKIRVLRR